jgi:hypothetical protein
MEGDSVSWRYVKLATVRIRLLIRIGGSIGGFSSLLYHAWRQGRENDRE